MKLRYWIIIGYTIPIVLALVSAGIVTLKVREVEESVMQLDRTAEVERAISNFGLSVEVASKNVRGYLLQRDPFLKQSYEEARATYLRLAEELPNLIEDEEQQELFVRLEPILAELDRTNQNLIALVDTGKSAEAIAAWRNDSAGDESRNISLLLQDMLDREAELIAIFKGNQDEDLDSLIPTIWAVTAASAVLAIAAGVAIVTGLVRRLNSSAAAISSSTSEIAATVSQQERVANEQASSVNETTTTMDELRASSRQSAEQAEAAAGRVRQMLVMAAGDNNGSVSLKRRSQDIAGQVIGLSEQLGQISNITSLVSDLASQTNMLAINAAVEAVRAGERGKGFGVVAAEIRQLADQSRRSAEKIDELLSGIQKATNATVFVTEEGNKAVDEMVEAINDIAVNVQQISLTAQQQAAAVAEVMGAMNNINAGSQQTASGIAQTKIGTQTLDRTATNLKDLV